MRAATHTARTPSSPFPPIRLSNQEDEAHDRHWETDAGEGTVTLYLAISTVRPEGT